MVKVKKTNNDNSETTREADIDTYVDKTQHGFVPELREKFKRCIGDVCFTPGDEGEIIVEIDKSKTPECAKLVAEYLLNKKAVRFDIKDSSKVQISED